MRFFIEPLVIFMVLFFPGLYVSLVTFSWGNPMLFSFDLNQEMNRIIAFNIPSLCLIWYFLMKEPIRSLLGGLRLQKKDFFHAAKVVLGLLIIGFVSSGIMNLIFHEDMQAIHIEGIFPLVVIVLSCITSAYTEESYFRVYLLNHFALSGISEKKAIIVSSVLFMICHFYQGPLGLLSSGFAGLFLSSVYIKRKSIHEIAIGHAFYNIISYFFTYFYQIS